MRRRRRIVQTAFDLMACHWAIACVKVGAARLHALDDRLADLHGGIAKLPLDAIRAVVARTPLDGLDSGSGYQLQYVASFESDILHSQMTGDMVCDFAERAGEIGAHQ